MNVYAVKHLDTNVVKKSRSGGIFTALSDMYIQTGAIYGCVLNEQFMAVHIRATETSERNLMRGSKYIQSHLGDTFNNIKKDLAEGTKVLFSGTSCQVAGLKRYLQKQYDNLMCVDIVCHGVPSSKVWSDYLAWISKGKKIVSVNFRDKELYGWRAHVETITLENEVVHSEVFKQLFYSHNIIRPACYECRFKSIHHPGDITIADYWGIEKNAPELDDNQGTSLVIINNEKGQELFDRISKYVVYKETNINDSLQPPLIAPFPRPVNRDRFWEDYQTHSFSYVVKKYANKGNFSRLLGILDRLHKTDKYITKGIPSKSKENLTVPSLFARKEDCCGCTACFSICPKRAIEMLTDDEGFEYPYIHEEKCVNCNRCNNVCFAQNDADN